MRRLSAYVVNEFTACEQLKLIEKLFDSLQKKKSISFLHSSNKRRPRSNAADGSKNTINAALE